MVVFVVILLIGTIIAVASKPSETALKNALRDHWGIQYGLGVVGEKFGLVQFEYHDYVVFSSLTVHVIGTPDQPAVYGFLGRAYFPGQGPNSNLSSNSKPPDRPVQLQPPPPAATPVVTARVSTPYNEAQNSQVDSQPEPTDSLNEESDNGWGGVRKILVETDMVTQVRQILAGRHPLSRIEGCEKPVVISTDLPLVHSQMVTGTFRCQMRGQVLGNELFVIIIRVRGGIVESSGILQRRVYGEDVLSDQRVQ